MRSLETEKEAKIYGAGWKQKKKDFLWKNNTQREKKEKSRGKTAAQFNSLH